MLKSLAVLTLIVALGHVALGSSCNCPGLYSPVCGSNGKTYGNACELQCAHVRSVAPIRVQSRGACLPPGSVAPPGQYQEAQPLEHAHQPQKQSYGPTKNTHNPQPVKQQSYQPSKTTYHPEPVKQVYQPSKTTYRAENVKQSHTGTKGRAPERIVEPTHTRPYQPSKTTPQKGGYHSVKTSKKTSTYFEESEESEFQPTRTAYHPQPIRNTYHPTKTTHTAENVKQSRTPSKGGAQERIVEPTHAVYNPEPVKQYQPTKHTYPETVRQHQPAKTLRPTNEAHASSSHGVYPQPNEPDAGWVPSFGGF